MGTWGVSPFGSDSAQDLLDTVGAMPPAERLALVERTLASGVESGDSPSATVLPDEVIAAVAIVAANLPGGHGLPWNDDVAGVVDWLPRPLPSGLPDLAARALDSAAPPDGWWWRSWVEESDRRAARDAIDQVRAALSADR